MPTTPSEGLTKAKLRGLSSSWPSDSGSVIVGGPLTQQGPSKKLCFGFKIGHRARRAGSTRVGSRLAI